ncbi:hypothetical protein [Metallibacterium sp.]
MHAPEALASQHRDMLDLLQQARLALLEGAVDTAHSRLVQLRALQDAHVAEEENEWIPYLPQSARWPATTYLAEHRKLDAMLDALCALLNPLPAHVSDAACRLDLLDRHLPYQHVLEHHFEREEKGLFREIRR